MKSQTVLENMYLINFFSNPEEQDLNFQAGVKEGAKTSVGVGEHTHTHTHVYTR